MDPLGATWTQRLSAAHQPFYFSCYFAAAVPIFDQAVIIMAAPSNSNSKLHWSRFRRLERSIPQIMVNNTENETEHVPRQFRSAEEIFDFLYDDRNASDTDYSFSTSTSAPSEDSLSGIIIFSWCVVAIFGLFFALLIAAHWRSTRPNVAKALNKPRQQRVARPTLLLEETVETEGAKREPELEKGKNEEF